MAYELFDPDRPDVAAGTRKEEIDKARNNLTALADMLAAFSGMQGFDVEITDSDTYGPTEVTATNGMQVVRKTITYNGPGVTEGLPDTIDYEKSLDGGSSWDAIATQTFTYDGGGAFVSYAWS